MNPLFKKCFTRSHSTKRIVDSLEVMRSMVLMGDMGLKETVNVGKASVFAFQATPDTAAGIYFV